MYAKNRRIYYLKLSNHLVKLAKKMFYDIKLPLENVVKQLEQIIGHISTCFIKNQTILS